MRKEQSGFTLIELVVVIVILGILAATALPKFIDLSGNANTAATQGIAGALASASSINYGAEQASNASTTAVTSCSGATSLLQSGIPTGYTITPTTAITKGGTISCTVTGGGTPAATASFVAIGA